MNWQLFDAFGIFLGFAANLIVSQTGDDRWRYEVASVVIPTLILLRYVLFISLKVIDYLFSKDYSRSLTHMIASFGPFPNHLVGFSRKVATKMPSHPSATSAKPPSKPPLSSSTPTPKFKPRSSFSVAAIVAEMSKLHKPPTLHTPPIMPSPTLCVDARTRTSITMVTSEDRLPNPLLIRARRHRLQRCGREMEKMHKKTSLLMRVCPSPSGSNGCGRFSRTRKTISTLKSIKDAQRRVSTLRECGSFSVCRGFDERRLRRWS